MLRKTVLFALPLLLLACTAEKKVAEIEIRPDTESSNTLYFEKVFEDFELIPLETRTTCVLTAAKRVEYFQQEYYIADVGSQNCVLVFDEKGQFKRKIGVLGHGHGEYPAFYDFTIDQARNRVVVLSANSTVYIYDLQGKFQESKELGIFPLWNITCKGNLFLLTSNHFTPTDGNDAFLFFLFDEDFNLKSKSGSVLESNPSIPCTVTNILEAGTPYTRYLDAFTNRLFLLDDQMQTDKEFKYVLKDPMPEEAFSNQQLMMEMQTQKDFVIANTFVDERLVTFYIHKGEPMLVVSDMEGHILTEGKYVGLVPEMECSTGNEIVCVPSPTMVQGFLAERAAFEEDGASAQLEVVTPESNHYILKFKLKKNFD